MNKRKWLGYVMTGALSVGLVGGASLTAFAATENSSNTVSNVQSEKVQMDAETKEKVQAIMDELKTNLTKLGVEVPEKKERSEKFAGLDDATKEKVKAIMQQMKEGTITSEEAKTQLAKLGVELPEKAMRSDLLEGLDDETKEKAQTLIDKAKDEVEQLGVDHFPFWGNK